MHPKIGVLPLYNSEKQVFWINPLYFRGVEQAGGIPVLLSLTDDESLWEEYCRLYDGFVFTGGQDVGPAFFGTTRSYGWSAGCGSWTSLCWVSAGAFRS